MQLKLTKRTVDRILVIECNGRIVFGEESSLLREEVKQAIADGTKRIVVNLPDKPDDELKKLLHAIPGLGRGCRRRHRLWSTWAK